MKAQWRIPESALIVIYNQFGQVLVLQRNDDPSFWQSVTGTREKGETPEQTALREVKEETGIDVKVSGYQLIDCEKINQYEIRPCWRHRYPANVTINTEHVFSLQVSANQEITLTEHSNFAWLSKPQALSKVWSPTNKNAIEQFVPNVTVSDGMLQQ
jgi:dihydroneopterin triphosphate diphosphatase